MFIRPSKVQKAGGLDLSMKQAKEQFQQDKKLLRKQKAQTALKELQALNKRAARAAAVAAA